MAKYNPLENKNAPEIEILQREKKMTKIKEGNEEETIISGDVTNESLSSTIERKSDVIVSSLQCDMVLESMEECVGFCDGIDEQQIFEEGLRKQAAHQRQIATKHGLSEAETALIRLQMIDATVAGSAAAEGILSAVENMDDILEQVCGASSNIVNSTSLTIDLCDGVVLPMDTTLPTSLPGNEFVDSKQGKSARSLVDVAAEDDAIQECENGDALYNLTADECAICNDFSATYGNISPKDGSRKPVFCQLPCCEISNNEEPQGGKYSNFKVCTACILVLTVATQDGLFRVGRCPRCREWISILTLHSASDSMIVRTLQRSGKCESCLQIKTPLVIEDPATCDACFLGKETSLTYECEECHEAQVIQSTMYRSQLTSKSFGNEMCPCNNCQKSTHWRIQYDQLPFIPANDVPEEWGDDFFLELARTRVHAARQGIAELELLGRNALGQKAKEQSCIIM